MAQDPATLQRIALLRKKSLDKTITIDEMREAILLMRQGRLAIPQATAGSRAKKAQPEINSDQLLADF